MTATDRAFIKAYQPRSATAPLHARATQSAAPARAEAEDPDPYAPALPAPQAAHVAPVAPVKHVAPVAAVREADEMEEAELAAVAAVYADPHSQPPAPLPLPVKTPPKFAPRVALAQPLSTFAPVIEVERSLVAALEVEAFVWPEACEKLLERASGQFDQLAARVASEAIEGRNLIAFSGAARGEGRTTTLLALARRLAACGVQTVVVDADFSAPGLAEALSVEVEQGWDDVLASGAALQEALVASEQDGLSLLPLRAATTNAAGLASRLQVAVSLGMLAEHFDVVLIDVGPAAAAAPLLRQLSGVNLVLLRDERRTPDVEVADLERELATPGGKLLAVAENFCAPPAANAPARTSKTAA